MAASYARAFGKSCPETRILMLSAYDEKVLIEEAKKLGVHGYLTKTRGGEARLRAVDALSANQAFFPEPD
jgi:DNA-binding NarL/FixJ family response regulator